MSSARDVAREVLRRVEQEEAYSGLALAAELERAALGQADRGLATEIVYGVLRHRTRLDRALASCAAHGKLQLSLPALIALRVAAYQHFDLRVPDHAVVNDAVGAIREVAGDKVASFANALLRRLCRDGEPPPPPATDVVSVLELVHSVPRWLGAQLIAAVGAKEAVAAATVWNRPPPVTLRVVRGTRDELAARVREDRPTATVEVSPLLAEALLVRGGGAPETLPAFQDGTCTVQDLGAQLVGRLCDARDGERVLDACAGVGGKATHLLQLARVEVHAVDVSERKLDLAMQAARRMRLEAGLRVIVCDLTAPPPGALADDYDRVLLDAPCSGLGVLRRHPETRWRRRPADLPRLVELQARLLDALAPRVRLGGVLVYSVCTFLNEEGPAQVDRFLAAHPEFEPAPPPTAVSGVEFAPVLDERGHLLTWPHRHDADGFFAARFRRRPV
ncbi:MAG: 16S rRNA (cytosine(967)-C(5))-methyltransferase RsmB [Myxococcales bacterium]|nr:16S rRNA (cytosine(967)-C(5))-methyltransferase RsmB [Myxococcales bacterium]